MGEGVKSLSGPILCRSLSFPCYQLVNWDGFVENQLETNQIQLAVVSTPPLPLVPLRNLEPSSSLYIQLGVIFFLLNIHFSAFKLENFFLISAFICEKDDKA